MPASGNTETPNVDIVFTVLDSGNVDDGGSNESSQHFIRIVVNTIELAEAIEPAVGDLDLDLDLDVNVAENSVPLSSAVQVQSETLIDTPTGVP